MTLPGAEGDQTLRMRIGKDQRGALQRGQAGLTGFSFAIFSVRIFLSSPTTEPIMPTHNSHSNPTKPPRRRL